MGEQQSSTQHPGERDAGATHVVTCFILRNDRGRDEVLLVRRSDHVRTYRGRWAGVSGYVEPGVSPHDQAYVELREETQLSPEDVRLLAEGAPLPVIDKAQGLSWVVHPFLFQIGAPEHIQTDWEAQATQWMAPGEVANLATVPGLADALALVYPVGGARSGRE